MIGFDRIVKNTEKLPVKLEVSDAVITCEKQTNPGRKSAFFPAVRRAKCTGNDITLWQYRARLKSHFCSVEIVKTILIVPQISTASHKL